MFAGAQRWGGALSNAATRPSFCLSVPQLQLKRVHFRTGHKSTQIGSPMLEVEPTDQRGRSAAESGRRGRAHIVSPLSVRYLVALSAVINTVCVLIVVVGDIKS